ncbi:hypothetical protein C8R46DRAFT_1096912 [Mycena filopes]|nr:hypothetical protein C8R46DRAFT_1096894 [Mycena filopes]KAJ7166031.1 hypothetical protein C8R46DRAFT_1096912 [Mycena filopes]
MTFCFLKLSANLDCWELYSACWKAAILNISKISAPRPGAICPSLHRIGSTRRTVSSRGVPMARNSGNTAARDFAPGMYGSHAARPRSCESPVLPGNKDWADPSLHRLWPRFSWSYLSPHFFPLLDSRSTSLQHVVVVSIHFVRASTGPYMTYSSRYLC